MDEVIAVVVLSSLGYVVGWLAGRTQATRSLARAAHEGRSPMARAMREALKLSPEHDR